MSDAETDKRKAARVALDHVAPGMTLGLGTGSTTRHLVELLGEKCRAGLAIRAVPSSEATAAQALALGVPLTTLEAHPQLDLTIDGADEIDAELRLIKGGGGALLREKIVAAASNKMIVIGTQDKFVARLGAFALPIEVIPFGFGATRRHIEKALARLGLAQEITLRQRDDHVFVTDGGHWIVDCHLDAIADPAALANALAQLPGVVEHGLFLGMATGAVLCGPAGVTYLGDLAIR